MCRFEDCWNKGESCVYTDKSIIANIKPEIGKIRPIVVIYSHKQHRIALVVPFTTKEPQKGNLYTVFIPKGVMPGILAKKDCWALCDMLKSVSLSRLQLPFSGEKNLRETFKSTMLEKDKFNEICLISKNVF
jgi:uncharacterized protein YifN (PemK superfamily)